MKFVISVFLLSSCLSAYANAVMSQFDPSTHYTTSKFKRTDMFSPSSQVDLDTQNLLVSWFANNCNNLSWVMGIEEDESQFKTCKSGDVTIHMVMELSHLKSAFVFKIDPANGSVISLYEENRSWGFCQAGSDLVEQPPQCQ